MADTSTLMLNMAVSLKAQNAGLFISRGYAHHPTRVLSSHELIFVKQGELDMFEGDVTFHLEAGDALHLWPGRRHGSTKLMPAGLRFYWIHFTLEDTSSDYADSADAVVSAAKIPQVVRFTEIERLERLFRTFLDDQETGRLHAYSANLLTMLMLNEVAQAQEQHQSRHDANVLATWADTYIRINFDRPITTSTIAEALGFNADYLGRIYRQSYGYTLTEAIHMRRVKTACRYLLDSNLSVQQIALKCGYADADYFRRIFRRYMRVSPHNYRTEYAHLHVNTH